MKTIIHFFLFFALLYSSTVNAQWRMHNGANAPFGQAYSGYKIAYDNTREKLWVFSSKFTVGHVLLEYTETNGWATKPAPPFTENENVVSVKFRNGTGWCLTTQGLYKFENDQWGQVTLPAGYSVMQTLDGLYVDSKNVWFTGGPQGKGITKFDGLNWVNYNKQNSPGLGQDIALTDISMNEEDSVLWVSTNCFADSAGVYSFDIKNNDWHLYNNIDQKYSCVHGVVPVKNGAIVGTCNFSSIRVLDNNGIFKESIDGNFKVGCISKMEADPDNESWAWVMSDWKLFHFKDTLNYNIYDTLNTPVKGQFMYDVAIQEEYHDSSRIWVITDMGLFSYTYTSKGVTTGINDPMSVFDDMQVYPNPGKGTFTLASQSLSNVAVEIRDSYGKLVHHKPIVGSELYSVDMSDLPAGIYFITISNGAARIFRKLILTE
jgi:hypothetical protein